METKKTFYLFWRFGKKEKVEGTDIAAAFNNAGYGGGAIRALDFYSEKDSHEWNAEQKAWENKEAVIGD